MVWGLSRNVIVLGLVSFLTDLAGEMIVPLLPIFLKRELLVGPAALGVISGISESIASFLKLFSGWLSDRLGKRKAIIVAGYSVASVLRPLMGIASSWWHVLAIRTIDRIGKGFRIAPRDALLADSCPEELRGRAFGFQQFADNLGAAIGPLLALMLLLWVTDSLRAVFLLSAIPGVLIVIAAGAGIEEKAPMRTGQPVPLSLKPFDRRFRLYLLATLLFHCAIASDFFLVVRMDAAEFSIPKLLLSWFAFCGVRSLSAMFGGVLSDRLGRRFAILIGWLLFVATWTAFAFAPTPWVLAPILAFGVFGGLAQGPQRAFVADLVPAHARGTAYGLYACAIGIATFVGNIGFGALWQWASMRTAFLAGTGIAACGLLVLLTIPRSSPSSSQ